MVHKIGVDRVRFHILGHHPNVAVFDRAGIEPRLPDVAAGSTAGVPVARVCRIGASQDAGHGVRALGDGQQVDVIGHQAIRPDDQAELAAVLPEHVEVDGAVLIGEKGGLPAISPGGYVVRKARHDNAGETGHSHG